MTIESAGEFAERLQYSDTVDRAEMVRARDKSMAHAVLDDLECLRDERQRNDPSCSFEHLMAAIRLSIDSGEHRP